MTGDVDSVNAMADAAQARMTLESLVERVDRGITPYQRQMIVEWIPKVRKVIEEIGLLCKTHVPSVDDALAEILENGEWNPERYYLVTLECPPDLRPQMPLCVTGDRVSEMLKREDYYIKLIQAIYQIEDDGTVTRKR